MAWGIGLVVGPSLGGLIGQTNLRLPAFFAAGLSLLNLALGFLILPESLPKERRESTPIQPQQINHL